MFVLCTYTYMYMYILLADDEVVKVLKKLRPCADDFEMKGIIGRGHFGEVGS